MAEKTAAPVELGRYLRLLWNTSPSLLPPLDALDDGVPANPNPSLSNLGLHLPLQAPCEDAAGDWYRASAAHAVAHTVYSRERFDAKSLKPITRVLVGLLEDARVEWLACRELPGLRRLWMRFHGQADEGHDFEALMRRLARVLLDPQQVDAHPWVQKGRALFFGDDEGRTARLRTAADVRAAASRLGHDIGQMRLPFNPRLYAVSPSYRDDHAVLWEAAERAKPMGAAEVEASGESPAADGANAPNSVAVAHLHPEWDRLIGRHRLRWCTVLERAAVEPLVGPAASRAWISRSPSWPTRAERSRRHEEGDDLDLPAAVDAWIDVRRQQAPDTRLYAPLRRHPMATVDLWLLDLSASTAPEPLRRARAVVSAAADAASRAGAACAIDGFRSCGRHEVHYLGLKRFDEPMGDAVRERLAALQGAGSTRLGAAVRHATQRLLQHAGSRAHAPWRRLFVVTDGDPYDIDIHDPRYLVDDACRAVQEARRAGVEVTAVITEPESAGALRRIFGAHACRR